ncbi:MAG: hypothetical protein ACXQTH_00870 [Dehalococcoidia bacterium]
MKRLLLLISILALVMLPIGCADIGSMIEDTIEEALAGLRADYTIEVGGTAGLNFSGRYVVVTAAYDPDTYVAFNSTSHDVAGTIFKQYAVKDAISVGGMFQKLSVNGTLEVEILRGGVVVDSASTTEPFGAVLVTAVKED